MIKILEGCYQFGVEEEQKAIDRYNGEISDNGIINFQNQENALNYKKDIENLSNMEVGIDFEKIKISSDDFGNQTISPSLLLDLSNVILFE